MDEIKNEINTLLREILESCNDLKSQINLMKNKNCILEKIDKIISMYEKEKNEK